MSPTGRRAVVTALLITAATLSTAALSQTSWPSRPIKIIVPFAAGGTSDVLARLLSEKLATAFGQPVFVDNKPGAGGVVGADAVAKSRPNGYTLLLGTISSHAINPALRPNMPYDALKDFAPVILLGSISNVLLVGASQPYQKPSDVVAAAKADPSRGLVFASAGQGSSQHMSGELFKLSTGAPLTHVPYRGSGPAVQAVLSGEVPMSFETVTSALPQIKGGKARALAVTSAARSAALPDVPTLQESGVKGFDVASWQAVYAPAGTPAAVVQKINTEIENILAQPDVKEKMEGLGLQHVRNSPKQFATFNANEVAKWTKVVKEGDVKPE